MSSMEGPSLRGRYRSWHPVIYGRSRVLAPSLECLVAFDVVSLAYGQLWPSSSLPREASENVVCRERHYNAGRRFVDRGTQPEGTPQDRCARSDCNGNA